ncbi:hypothetical protein [Streptomyces sp. Tu 3180]|uniref:hypothetical protein n=1 Tax=Streptomyces sp. Tu 3180 TaxID=2682611 RepID=UPI0013592A58|nr:hypothetical protein [Streptomyces sp. Tu 3180]KAF3465506.1 hypothetical protein GL259_14960 [Streptomyces sp. Tu 3180]
MTAAAREGAPVALEGDGVELRTQPTGGGPPVGCVRLPRGTDMGPALEGLPGDACPCPHRGHLLEGRLRMRTAEGEQDHEAGQACHWAPGHVPLVLEDCAFVEFSPTDDFRKVTAHIARAA